MGSQSTFWSNHLNRLFSLLNDIFSGLIVMWLPNCLGRVSSSDPALLHLFFTSNDNTRGEEMVGGKITQLVLTGF